MAHTPGARLTKRNATTVICVDSAGLRSWWYVDECLEKQVLWLTSFQAPFPLLQHRWLRYRAWSYLGIFHRYFDFLSGQRRYCWSDMACSHRHFWHVQCHALIGRNGQHGTDIGRSIPLGFRVCACKIPKAAVVCCWLAGGPWMAICYAHGCVCWRTADTRLDLCLQVW